MDTQPEHSKRKELATVLAVLIMVAVIVGAVAMASKSSKDQQAAKVAGTSAGGASASQSNGTTDTAGTSSVAGSAAYKDGQYTATGSYVSPGGSERITIQVTLKDGVVAGTAATSGASDPEGQEYQNQFIQGYKKLVVGKPIDSISLSRVSGSSLTSQGFNDALKQIEQQAKA